MRSSNSVKKATWAGQEGNKFVTSSLGDSSRRLPAQRGSASAGRAEPICSIWIADVLALPSPAFSSPALVLHPATQVAIQMHLIGSVVQWLLRICFLLVACIDNVTWGLLVSWVPWGSKGKTIVFLCVCQLPSNAGLTSLGYVLQRGIGLKNGHFFEV